MVKADNLVGQVIGGYRISFDLPSQGTSSLYLGESEAEPGRQVTLKLFSSHPLSSQVDQDSFLHEATMFQHLEHPHIVPLLDYGLMQDLPYIVTPYTSWRPLSTHIRRHWSAPFTLPQTLLLLWQLGEALDYAHQQHLFHGQLTPRCVLLDDQQRPLLTDFRFTSLATGATFPQDSHPESGYYLAPEQRIGRHKKESDQYALACIAYELLTGRRPTLAATDADEVGIESPVAPSALNPAVPAALDKTLLKALSFEPEQRFASMREFLAALPQPPEETGGEPDAGVIQPDMLAAVPAEAQAQSWQATQQAPVRDVAAPSPFISAHQGVQTNARPQLITGLQRLVQNSPIHQVQAPPYPALPTYEQQPGNQQSWLFQQEAALFQPEAAQFQPRISEPVSSPIAPPPPGMPTLFAPAPPPVPPIPPDPFSMPMPVQPTRTWFPRMARPLVIIVALLVVVGSGLVMFAAFAHPTRPTSTATAAQGSVKLNAMAQTTQTVVLPTQTVVLPQSNPAATAQAQIIATAQAQGKPQLLWTFTAGGPIQSSPSVVDGVVYAGSQDHNLYAIDTVTAQQKWTFDCKGYILSLPAVSNGIVYTGSADSGLHAIDATSGQQKWVFWTGSGVSASPAVANGIVYISSGDGKLFAVDAATGQQKWTFAAKAAFWRSLTVANGVVYAGSIDDTLYAIDAASGQQKWAFQTAGYIVASATVANGVVYVGSMDHKLYAIDAITGQQKWNFVTGAAIWSAPTVVNGVVYVGSHDHKLYAIDATTGQQKWAFTTGGPVWSSPTVVNGVVYVGSMDHKLYAIDATTGQQKWAFTTGDAIQYSSPTVVNGVVYIGSNDHKLYAIAIG